MISHIILQQMCESIKLLFISYYESINISFCPKIFKVKGYFKKLEFDLISGRGCILKTA